MAFLFKVAIETPLGVCRSFGRRLFGPVNLRQKQGPEAQVHHFSFKCITTGAFVSLMCYAVWMAKLMTVEDCEALRTAAGGSFERAALNAGLRVEFGGGLVLVGLFGIEAGAPDVRVEEDETGYTMECFTDRASAWLTSLTPSAAST